jgi:tetratricopeptide (TPR) repeat protein
MLFDHLLRFVVARSCRLGIAASRGARYRRSVPASPCLGLLLSGLLLSSSLLSSQGRAQTDGETEVARQRFREGVAHYDRQDFEKARLAFLQAYLLRPHHAVLLNLAQSELRAGRHAEAAENFAKYVRENPTAPAMDHAKAGFEEARQRVTELNVQVNATGATVSIDGADMGRSPLPNALYLMPGRHSVVARKGTASAEKVLDALAGRREYITLELREGYTPIPVAPGTDTMSTSTTAGTVGAETGTDGGQRQGFFDWLGSSPAAVATISVAGLALGTSAVLAGFANNRYAAANDAKSQIMAALQRDVNRDWVDPGSTPCGASGIAGGMATFGPNLTTPERQVEVAAQYRNACDVFTDRSDSGDRLKTLSLVSLGVGAFATIGTIVWYFSDSGTSSDSASPGDPPDPRRASLTPLLSPDTQGLMLEMSF